MKYLKRVLITLFLSILVVNMVMPVQEANAASGYGVIVGNKDYNFTLHKNLTVLSPENNIMIKGYSLSKTLGLTYSYNSGTKKITIKNPNNGKYLIFTVGSKNYSYYSGATAVAAVKTAAYKCYYDSATKANVIHAATLKYIVTYNYYGDLSDHYYGAMGYRKIVAFSINPYSGYDLPITEEVLTYVNNKTYTSGDELLDAIRLNLLARKTGITFSTYNSVMDEIGINTSIMNTVLALDSEDTSKDGDYLSLLIDRLRQNWNYTNRIRANGDTYRLPSDSATLSIQVDYESTLMQERIVDSKVAGIIKSLKLTDATDYEKVKKIHDYVINMASYDTSLQRSSAYELLVNKTSVCEGYTLAAYRLFTDAGLECKVITGYGNGESHAWNIVKVDGQWYNIDLTWDDPVSSSGKAILSYDYFLKSEADFVDHVRMAEYDTAEFHAVYPISEVSYE